MPLNTYTTRTIWRRGWPEVEAVTLRSRNASGSAAEYTDYSLNHAQVGVATAAEATASGVVAVGLRKRRISIFDDDLDEAGAPRPKVGDLIRRTRDGTEWVVQSAENGLFENEHGCDCQERA